MKSEWKDIHKDGIVPVWLDKGPFRSECPKCPPLPLKTDPYLIPRVYKHAEQNRWFVLCRKVHGWVELHER